MTNPGEYAIDLSALEVEARNLELKIKSLVGRVRQLETAIDHIEQSSHVQNFDKAQRDKMEAEMIIKAALKVLKGERVDD